jgi:hypothetical protein
MANLVFSQGIEWGKIEQIPEGYHYVIDSNSNGDIIVGGFELNSDYAMQIYYKQDNQDWIEIPGNEQVAIMNGDVLITDTQNIYVCDFAMGLYGTNDLGNIWTGLAELTNEGCSAFNIHDSGTFFAGMTYTGIGFIHRSFDNGLSWESISLPDYNSNYPVEHIEFDSEGNIYLGTINGIYKSTDIGENWQKMNSGINGEHVSSIFIDDNDNIYIYTTYSAQSDGMYYSFDNAESWVGMPIPDYYVVDIVAQDDIILIIDGYNNIQLTEDLGNTWYISNEGLNDNSLYSLQLVQNNIIYAGGRYIHKSNSSIDECIDLSGLDFGPCAMELGIGYVNGECSYVSGCGWILNGIDYSDASFDSMDECSSVCFENSFTLGDINNDSMINVQDIVLLVNFVLQTDFPDDTEFMAADVNSDGALNILDVVSIVDIILSPQVSIQINSGTSYGECWGYCVFELELDNSNALFTSSSWGNWYDEFLDLLLEDNLSQEEWQQLVDRIDFEYFQSLDDVYGCPDCADGGAEFIEIIYEGVTKQVTFEAYTEIDGIQELTILLRDLRAEYWNQINENQECSIMPEVGPCDGICTTYYYNQDSNECEEFIFGCCGPEAFDTMQGCIDSCE